MKSWLSKIFFLLLPVAVLAGGTGIVLLLFASAPRVERIPEERIAPVVEVVPVERGPVPRQVHAYGTVIPAREVEFVPEVAGRIIEIHESLEPGGIIPEGEVLIRIDPEEYELALSRAKGALAEAEAALDVEKGRQLVAEREWNLFGKDLPNAELGKSLALREPQLRQAEAQIASAKSVVDQAELDLRRTVIRAPFDVLVLKESVDVGQYVSPGTAIATMAGANTFWVQVSVAMDRLGALLEAAKTENSKVRIFSNVDSVDEATAVPARLVRQLGEVTEGRMAQLLLEVQDPLHRKESSPSYTPLVLNSYVRADLDAGPLEHGVTIPRRGLRENDEIWVVDGGGKVQVRDAHILWRQAEILALEDVFEADDSIIVSPVEDLVPGMTVQSQTQTPNETAPEPDLSVS